MKKFISFLILALGLAISGFSAEERILRDFDFKQFPCYGCPGDESMTQGIPAAVTAQQKKYNEFKAKYKKTWSKDDVEGASKYAFRTDVAAWPWVNYSTHLLYKVAQAPKDKKKDVLEQVQSEVLGALLKAEDILGDYGKGDAEKIKKIIKEERSNFNR